jgi:hypothetical protein
MRQDASLGVRVAQGLYDLAQGQATTDENNATATDYETFLKDGADVVPIMGWITNTWGQV